MEQSKLKPDETRMVRYDKLSPEGKARYDAQARKRADETKRAAEAGDSFGQRASDVMAKVLVSSPLNKRSAEDRADIAARAAEREKRRRNAEAEAALDVRDPSRGGKRLLPDVKPQKVDPDEQLFAKGGTVKGWGKARGAKACKGC